MDDVTPRSGPFWEAVDGRRPPPPAAALLGWQVHRIDPERGEVEVHFTATEAFTNPMGNIQGGFLAAMLDDTLGPALVATLASDEFPLTLELKVNYLRPARPGRLRGTGRVVHRGGTVAFLAGDLVDDAGRVLDGEQLVLNGHQRDYVPTARREALTFISVVVADAQPDDSR